LFTGYIVKNPDCLVIDVGAQIGQYTLFAAKLGSHVISVEPFQENIIRIHKAVTINSLNSKITLIANAISNKRNQVKLLQRVDGNIGGQSLLDNNHLVYNSRNKSHGQLNKNEYMVETILFDDLIAYLPKKNSIETSGVYGKAIMKIDIEGFEPYAFQHAKNLFKILDFQIIFMEWGVLNRYRSELHSLIIQMMNFLYANDLKPYVYNEAGVKELLNREQWETWPWDIFWEKNGENA
jgi:FkbM family methyltransferase